MACDYAPAVRLSKPAVEFMDNHLDAALHPSLSNPNIKYDPAVDTFGSEKQSCLELLRGLSE